MKNVICLNVHGIGSYRAANGEPKAFDERLMIGVKGRMGADFAAVGWERLHWSNGKLFDRQAQLMRERRPGRAWRAFFDFAINSLSDASAFQMTEDPASPQYGASAYFEIQSNVWQKLAEIEMIHADADGECRKPLMIVAHSMGCHVMSNYAWDARRAPERVLPPGLQISSFAALDTLSSVVFFGCNIPILTMGMPRESKVPLRVPKRPEGKESWFNFYDADDPLGYPLTPEFEAYFRNGGAAHARRGDFDRWRRDPAVEVAPVDVALKTRGLFGLTPAAHVQYWSDERIADYVARELTRLLGA